jgi:hypothetical protein
MLFRIRLLQQPFRCAGTDGGGFAGRLIAGRRLLLFFASPTAFNSEPRRIRSASKRWNAAKFVLVLSFVEIVMKSPMVTMPTGPDDFPALCEKKKQVHPLA